MKQGQRIAWRWKIHPTSFSEGYVRETTLGIARIAAIPYGEGSWYLIEEIEWYELPYPV